MEYNKRIKEMANGDQVEGFYILKDASVNKASNGSQFLSGSLTDISGSISMKICDYTGSFSGTDAGKVVKIRGAVSEYKGNLQMTVALIRLANSGEYDIAQLVPTAPIDDTLIPKYVDHLLKRRTRLSKLLRNACGDLDEYCAKIGVDFNDPDACLQSDIRIYCEQDGGESLTRAVIERTLRKNAEVEKNRGR